MSIDDLKDIHLKADSGVIFQLFTSKGLHRKMKYYFRLFALPVQKTVTVVLNTR